MESQFIKLYNTLNIIFNENTGMDCGPGINPKCTRAHLQTSILKIFLMGGGWSRMPWLVFAHRGFEPNQLSLYGTHSLRDRPVFNNIFENSVLNQLSAHLHLLFATEVYKGFPLFI